MNAAYQTFVNEYKATGSERVAYEMAFPKLCFKPCPDCIQPSEGDEQPCETCSNNGQVHTGIDSTNLGKKLLQHPLVQEALK